MSDVKFGVTYPAGLQAHCDVKRYVEAVEGSGYDSIWLIENVGSGTPGFECLTTLGYMAACSKTLNIGTSVLLLPLRNPMLLAQAATTLDQLSDGRLILGMGVGGAEHTDAMGVDSKTRGARCEEYMKLLKALWTNEEVAFDGRFQSVDGYRLAPRCVQSPHVPMWMGGHSDAALDRAGRLAQGFIPVGASPTQCAATYDALDTQTQALGRPALVRAVHSFLSMAGDVDTALDTASKTLGERFQASYALSDASPHIFGSRDECRRQVEAFMQVGISHFIFDPVCEIDDTLEQVLQFADQVLSEFR